MSAKEQQPQQGRVRAVDWALLGILASASLYGFRASEGFRDTFDAFRHEMKDSFVTRELFTEKIERLTEAVERGDGAFSRNMEARVGTLETRVTVLEQGAGQK